MSLHDAPDEMLARLYAASGEFRQAECWKTLYDYDWFVMDDLATGNVAVVSILGSLGELHGLRIYRFPEGIRICSEAAGALVLDPQRILIKNRMLEIEFVNKKDLHQGELAERDRLGIPNPGRKLHSYPRFMKLEPGLPCRKIDREDGEFLIEAIRLAITFRYEMERNPDFGETVRLGRLQSPPGYPYFRPVSKSSRQYEVEAITLPEMREVVKTPPIAADDLFAPRLAGLPILRGKSWIAVSVMMLDAVEGENGGRPRFPTLIALMDTPEHIGAHGLAMGTEDIVGEVQSVFTKHAESLGGIPEQLLAATPEALAALAPLAKERPDFTLIDPAKDPQLARAMKGLISSITMTASRA